ncbi:MAG: aminoacyl-tRNA hydrolase [Candidatus Shapirobacteria bacterium]
MLVLGLGNPEKEYQDNRHNTGKQFLDFLDQNNELNWQKRKDLLCFLAKKDDLYLAKSLTYMNDSGQAAQALVKKLKVKLNNFYLAHDELDLKLGEYKISFGKSSALHKGVLSVERELKSKDFWRVRIGVDNRDSENRIAGERYVLQDFRSEEEKKLKKVFEEIIVSLRGYCHPERSRRIFPKIPRSRSCGTQDDYLNCHSERSPATAGRSRGIFEN